MEINEVATLKVRELPAAADRKGSAGGRRRGRERGEGAKLSQVHNTSVSVSVSHQKEGVWGQQERAREREKGKDSQVDHILRMQSDDQKQFKDSPPCEKFSDEINGLVCRRRKEETDLFVLQTHQRRIQPAGLGRTHDPEN